MKYSLIQLRPAILLLGALTACSVGSRDTGEGVSSEARPVAKFQEGDGRMLLIGQSNQAAWDDFTRFGGAPAGGSVYYEVRSGDWNGGAGGIQKRYADFLADQRKVLEVGVSWKDNPPGWNGGDNGPVARQVTQDIANGTYDGQFQGLIDYINAHPSAKFLIRIDYEVSSYYHCLDDGCQSYKDAFNHVAELLSTRSEQKNVGFIYHPVRGEFEKLYPGDRWVDWIGISLFNHELCMPIYNQGQTFYNGTPGSGFDTSTNECKGYILKDVGGNANAEPHAFEYDFNVLAMMKFAQDHQKPMIASESAPMNFSAGEGHDGTEPEELVSTWVNRLFNLMAYRGPLPNQLGDYDLSNVIQAVVYINNDLRYGWDGKKSPDAGFEFPYDADWYINAQLSQYGKAKQAFCDGLSARGFTTRCGGDSGPQGGGNTGPQGGGDTGPQGGSSGGAQGGGDGSQAAARVPGTVATDVGGTSNGQTLTYGIDVASDGNYSFRVYGTAPESQLIQVGVDDKTETNATAGTNGGVMITSPAFTIGAGKHTLRVTVQGQGVSISKIEAL